MPRAEQSRQISSASRWSEVQSSCDGHRFQGIELSRAADRKPHRESQRPRQGDIAAKRARTRREDAAQH